MQVIVINEKNADLIVSDRLQILLAYKYLDSELRITLTELTQQITVAQFIKQLNFRKYVWFDLYSHRNPMTERVSHYNYNKQQDKS